MMGLTAECRKDKKTYDLRQVNRKAHVTWNLHGAAGRLEIECMDKELPPLEPGDKLSLSKDGKVIFAGYLFRISRDQEGTARCLAYDQLRYLQNRDTYAFTAMTAAEMLRKMAVDFGISTGNIEDTRHRIPALILEDRTLMDMMGEALRQTHQATGQTFALFDDAGKLSLRDTAKLRTAVDLGSAHFTKTFQHTLDIDKSAASVKLIYHDLRRKVSLEATETDTEKTRLWGGLQYFERMHGDWNSARLREQAASLLRQKAAPGQSIKLTALGTEALLRAGSGIRLRFPELPVYDRTYFTIDRITHRFEEEQHWMDLEICLEGGT